MDELIDIGKILCSFRQLLVWYESCEEKSGILDEYFNTIYENRYFEEKIFSIIISKDEIADKATSNLYEIRRKIRAKSNGIREKLDGMIHSVRYQKYLQDPIVTQRNGRFVLPVKAEYRTEVDGLIHDTSSSGATVFIEPSAVVQANNEIKILESDEEDEIQRILLELSGEAASFSQNIMTSYNSAVNLDLIFAKANTAYKMNAIKPSLNEKGVINLKMARHPLIDQSKVVPTDIYLGENFDTLIITGPNTGGKTVAIKTLGLFTLMTMCGMMVPAAEGTNICVFSKVLSDIGDEQNIQQNLSTFSSHMVNIIEIMSLTDSNSLILLDELGAGTDPIEGAALAVSIIEKLRESGAKIAATTHYTDLKAYALETDGVMNACCEFDINTLMPTYHLLMGVPGKSNAFAISKRLGMDSDVVNHAKDLVSSNSRSFENAIDELERNRLQLQQEIMKAEKETKDADMMKRRAQSQKDKIMSAEQIEIQRAKHEAEKIIKDAKRQSSAFLMELEKMKKESSDAANIKSIRRKVENSVAQLEDTVRENDIKKSWEGEKCRIENIKIGDSVAIKNIGIGKVLEINGANDILVQSGQIKIRVKIDDLRYSNKTKSENKTKQNIKVTKASLKGRGEVSTTIDLRGMTTEESISELDAFIYSAVLNNISTITIIHGKGTGTLRKAVHNMLESNKNIASFRLGDYGEGDTGVTIATLK